METWISVTEPPRVSANNVSPALARIHEDNSMASEERPISIRKFRACFAAAFGLLLASTSLAQTTPCPPTLVDEAGNPIAGASDCGIDNGQVDREQDWQARISGPGVVWHHNFESDAEVDQFREDGALLYDPNDDGPGYYGALPNTVYRNTSDFVTGSGCLEILRRAGSTDSKNWYRPMSPLSAPGNGRSSDDPAADGTIPLDADGAWGPPARTPDWQAGNYGPRSTGTWEGNEFYIQYALKVSSSRIAGSVFGGKVQYITRMDRSLTAQELVTTYDYNVVNWQMYRGGTGPFLTKRLGNPQHVFDDWATYLVHVVPGDEVEGAQGDQGGSNTRVNVYRHREGENGYTHIFTKNDLAIDYSNAYFKAWNAIILSGYFNGLTFPENFYQRYDEVIFSREHIPSPAW